MRVCDELRDSHASCMQSLVMDVDARFESKQLAAIMGPSGAGKTTVMDILTMRKNTGVITGSVLFGASPPTPRLMRKECAYVEQADTLLPNVTGETQGDE